MRRFSLSLLLLVFIVSSTYTVPGQGGGQGGGGGAPSGTLQTEILELNTRIHADSNFEILRPSPVEILLGDNRDANRIGYTFQSNAVMTLAITSENASTGGTMRMKHTEVSSAFLDYEMYFDYAGLGATNEVLVVNGAPAEMQGFDLGYDITGTFSILALDSETALAGDYQDTITFSFEAQ